MQQKEREGASLLTRLKPTELKLIQAAMAEFAEYGYSGTDSNKIARRAGFAPQTFYRWFKDKITIFIAAYRLWEENEWLVLTTLMQQQAAPLQIAQAVITQHRDHLLFRRSLRQLAVEHPQVRQARAESRLRQVERIRLWLGASAPDTASLLLLLLQMERLADAIAEGELTDVGVAEAAGVQAMIHILAQYAGNS